MPRHFNFDEKIIRRIIWREGMTEATIEYLDAKGKLATKVIPFTGFNNKNTFQAQVNAAIAADGIAIVDKTEII